MTQIKVTQRYTQQSQYEVRSTQNQAEIDKANILHVILSTCREHHKGVGPMLMSRSFSSS